MRGKWDGTLWSASDSVAHDGRIGGISFRPMVAVDYYKLKEDGYAETGGGDALDLTVARRPRDELAARGTVALHHEFGSADLSHALDGLATGDQEATTAHRSHGPTRPPV